MWVARSTKTIPGTVTPSNLEPRTMLLSRHPYLKSLEILLTLASPPSTSVHAGRRWNF